MHYGKTGATVAVREAPRMMISRSVMRVASLACRNRDIPLGIRVVDGAERRAGFPDALTPRPASMWADKRTGARITYAASHRDYVHKIQITPVPRRILASAPTDLASYPLIAMLHANPSEPAKPAYSLLRNGSTKMESQTSRHFQRL